MHHGYYDPKTKNYDHKQAQIDMIDRTINWCYGDEIKTVAPKSIVDVGCGVGGSSRHIVKR
jgi:tocopherol O-methyltransferase